MILLAFIAFIGSLSYFPWASTGQACEGKAPIALALVPPIAVIDNEDTFVDLMHDVVVGAGYTVVVAHHATDLLTRYEAAFVALDARASSRSLLRARAYGG